jgi:hypothetical protein
MRLPRRREIYIVHALGYDIDHHFWTLTSSPGLHLLLSQTSRFGTMAAGKDAIAKAEKPTLFRGDVRDNPHESRIFHSLVPRPAFTFRAVLRQYDRLR